MKFALRLIVGQLRSAVFISIVACKRLNFWFALASYLGYYGVGARAVLVQSWGSQARLATSCYLLYGIVPVPVRVLCSFRV